VAQRLAVVHRAVDTNAPGGHLHQTPGQGACVSLVAACADFEPPAPATATNIFPALVEVQADPASAWAHGVKHSTT